MRIISTLLLLFYAMGPSLFATIVPTTTKDPQMISLKPLDDHEKTKSPSRSKGSLADASE